MALYQLKIAYDGTNFLGFQKQGKGRTIQAEIEKALRQLEWKGISIQSAGRTDTGVHASGQVVSFRFERTISKEKLQKAINAILPTDIVIREISFAPEGFHPRFSARARRYHYHLYCQEHRDPLRNRFSWKVWPGMDDLALEQTASQLVGEHDFRGFGKPPSGESGTIRKILDANWKRKGNDFLFVVEGNAFLYHMVRRMVYLQVMVAQGRIAMQDFQSAITGDKRVKPGIAPACGLELFEVSY
jgi:tRNA pseudouridine38-40 synthase